MNLHLSRPNKLIYLTEKFLVFTTVQSLISRNHWGKRFCPLMGSVRFLESLAFLPSFRKFCNFIYVLGVETDIRVTLREEKT